MVFLFSYPMIAGIWSVAEDFLAPLLVRLVPFLSPRIYAVRAGIQQEFRLDTDPASSEKRNHTLSVIRRTLTE